MPAYDVEGLSKHIVVGKECASLVEYLKGFDITLKVLQKPCTYLRRIEKNREE